LLEFISLTFDRAPPKAKAANSKSKGKGKAKRGTRKDSKKEVPPEEGEWLPGWRFFHRRPPPRALAKLIQPQLDYIERMIKGWRPTPPKKMGMPEDWFVSGGSSPRLTGQH